MDAGINHRTEDVVARVMELTDDRGVDLVYEHVGGELFQKGLDSLTKDGRLVICGGALRARSSRSTSSPSSAARRASSARSSYTREEVEKCFDLAARGLIKPLVHQTFPLDDAGEAMAAMERREHFGKLVLVP